MTGADARGALRVGTAGWSYPDWKGRVYPARPPKGFDPLGYLAGFVDMIEINSSFYRPPSASSAVKWLGAVANRRAFRFTAKLYRGFTHEAPAGWNAADMRAFHDGLRPLAEAGRLDALLVQFPFFFTASPENLDHLTRIAESFAIAPRVLEVRHRSFLAPDVLARLEHEGWSFCNIDQPRSSTSIEAVDAGLRITGPVGYLRLHGRNASAWFDRNAGRDQKYDYLYDAGELRAFVPMVAELVQRCETVHVVTNNHFLGKAVANALELKGLLGGGPVAVPPDLLESFPQLRGIAARVEGSPP